MQTYGLLGYPLGHSFSAGYFAEKFEKQGVDAEYVNFEFPDVASAVSHLRSVDNLCGFNVTIPYKQQIIPYLDTLSPEAREMGAVNVVCVRRDATGNVRWHGDNSDWIGFSRSLQPLLDQGADTIVLGCTHYPFLLDTMRSIAGPGVEFIDPAPAVARHLEEVLEKNGKCARNTTPGTVELLASGDDTALRRTFQLIY